jgi:hypothetical protein
MIVTRRRWAPLPRTAPTGPGCRSQGDGRGTVGSVGNETADLRSDPDLKIIATLEGHDWFLAEWEIRIARSGRPTHTFSVSVDAVKMGVVEVAPALPRIDDHNISVDVPADRAWPLVVSVFERLTTQPAWRAFAKALRCRPDRAIDDPHTVGASLPGFRVTQSQSPTKWRLEGAHLFSQYSLTFRVTPLDGQHCLVSAETSASFPGHHGAAYRAFVIGTGGHAIGVRGILRRIKVAAERSVGPGTERDQVRGT